MHSGYVPLRVFSCYTMLDGAIDPKAIAKQARGLGFPAAALTDRNGTVVDRYAPTTKPADIRTDIEKLL